MVFTHSLSLAPPQSLPNNTLFRPIELPGENNVRWQAVKRMAQAVPVTCPYTGMPFTNDQLSPRDQWSTKYKMSTKDKLSPTDLLPTKEHVQPQSKGGKKGLSNCLLAASKANAERAEIELARFYNQNTERYTWTRSHFEDIQNYALELLAYVGMASRAVSAEMQRTLPLQANAMSSDEQAKAREFMNTIVPFTRWGQDPVGFITGGNNSSAMRQPQFARLA